MIKNWQEHDELQQLVLEAGDRLASGEGRSGTHYELMHILRNHSVFANSREEAVRKGQEVCDAWIMAVNSPNVGKEQG